MAKNSLVNCMHHVSPRRLFAGKSAWYPSEGMPRASFTAGVWRFYTVREVRILPMPRGSSSQNPRNLNFGKSRDLSREDLFNPRSLTPRNLPLRPITEYQEWLDWAVSVADQFARPVYVCPVSANQFLNSCKKAFSHES